MEEPIWMDSLDAVITHEAEITRHGGSVGVRDSGLLESAIARPRNIWAYEESKPSLARLAAAYAFGISANPPFVDGNKRTALLVSFVFLDANGIEVTASQEDAYLTILALGAGEVSEDQLTQWFESNTAARRAAGEPPKSRRVSPRYPLETPRICPTPPCLM